MLKNNHNVKKPSQSHSCLEESSRLLLYHVPSGHERPHRCGHGGWVLAAGAGVCQQQPTGSPLLIALRSESLAISRRDDDFLEAW